VVGVSLLAAAAPAAAQTDEQRAGARTLATEGAQAFNEGRFKDAVDLFSKAESLVHAPPHLLFMARAHAKLGQFVKAREAYWKILKEPLAPNAPQAFKDAQAAAEKERKDVEPHIGRLMIKVEGGDAAKDLAIAVDGQPMSTVLLGVPQPSDPGEHTVTVTATGFKAAPAKVTIKDAGLGSVVIKLEVDASAAPPSATPAAAPATSSAPAATSTPAPMSTTSPATSDTGKSGPNQGMRTGAYVGFGVGAVGIVLGTVFVLKSASKRSDADKAAAEITHPTDGSRGCDLAGGFCSADDPKVQNLAKLDDQARSAKTIGIVGYVVGGVGVATGVTLFVLSNKKGEQNSAFVAPYVGVGALGVRGAF
jgi:hypothetical protein